MVLLEIQDTLRYLQSLEDEVYLRLKHNLDKPWLIWKEIRFVRSVRAELFQRKTGQIVPRLNKLLRELFEHYRESLQSFSPLVFFLVEVYLTKKKTA